MTEASTEHATELWPTGEENRGAGRHRGPLSSGEETTAASYGRHRKPSGATAQDTADEAEAA